MLCDTEAGLLTASADVAETPPVIAATIREMVPRGLRGTAMVSSGDGYIRIQPVGAETLRGFLAYGTEHGSISEYQGSAAAFAAWLLCIDLERQHVVRALQRRPREEAAERLARGVTPAAAQQLLRSLGMHADRVKVALAQPPSDDISDAVSRLSDLIPEALVGRDRSAVLIIAQANLPDLAARLAAGVPAWPVGLGGPVQPHQCPISLRQAQRGVQLAQQRGGGVLDVMTLASARVLLEGVSTDMLRSYADATLRPVESADGGELLLRTLRAWLAACGVADSAAATAGVHRHTLRHRLQRVEQLTGRRLDNAHDRGELISSSVHRCLPARNLQHLYGHIRRTPRLKPHDVLRTSRQDYDGVHQQLKRCRIAWPAHARLEF